MKRNDIILFLILEGFTLQQVARNFEITSPRINQIVHKTALKYDKNLKSNSNSGMLGVKELRKNHKYKLIKLIAKKRKEKLNN